MSNDQSNSSDESANENLNPVSNMEDYYEPGAGHVTDDESAEIANPTSSLSTDDLPVHGNDPTVNDEPAIPSGSSGSQPKNYDHGECAICMGPQTDKSRLNCGHVFCFECLVNWCRIKLQCPTCRQPFSQFVHNSTGSAQGEIFTPVPPPAPRRTYADLPRLPRTLLVFDGNGWVRLNDEAFHQFMMAFRSNIPPRTDDQPNQPNDPSGELN